MSNKTPIYFNEVSQTLVELPLFEEHCYYLGRFSQSEIELIDKWLDEDMYSYKNLMDKISNKLLVF